MKDGCAPPRLHLPVKCRRLLYARAVLKHAGLPVRNPQVRCLVAVMTGEGSTAHWNPMDTTLHQPGAVAYNSFGPDGEYHVWDYPSAQAGITATVATLKGADMAGWYRALQDRHLDATQLCQAFAETPWAYRGDRLPAEITAAWADGHRSYKADWDVIVQGPGRWPYGVRG